MSKEYGSWKSPVTADLALHESIHLSSIRVDGPDVYWVESRPHEQGRCVIVKRSSEGIIRDVTHKPFSARSGVHEYGGGEYSVSQGSVYFSNFRDQRIYIQKSDAKEDELPIPISAKTGNCRYADSVIDSQGARLFAVREQHTEDSKEPINSLIVITVEDESDGPTITTIHEGKDFYSDPRLSPNETELAYLAWNHPNMPWDGTALYIMPIKPNGTFSKPKRVAGGKNESICQPQWSPDGTLYFISDRSNWWNLYKWDRSKGKKGKVTPVCQQKNEFAGPGWRLGSSTYAFMDEDRIACTYSGKTGRDFGILDVQTGELEPVDVPFHSISSVKYSEGKVWFIGGSPTLQPSIVMFEVDTDQCAVVRKSWDLDTADLEPYFSQPQFISFPTTNQLQSYGYYYPPANPDYHAMVGTKAPLLVKIHGGPTGSTSTTLRLDIQYWTSRGFAVLDVNYGGSTGYGREYRERLKGNWGIVDVDDCCNGALYMAQEGLVDGKRLAITGRSAGGFTALAALTFKKVFTAGASYFGISDLEALAKETHKFESHYCEGLVGPYPQKERVYQMRSPVRHVNNLNCPLVLFQGTEDKISPPEQAQLMHHALQSKGIPVAYVPFEGESHGFRNPKNSIKALQGELYFYSRIFNFEPADQLDGIHIDNLGSVQAEEEEQLETNGGPENKLITNRGRVAGKASETACCSSSDCVVS